MISEWNRRMFIKNYFKVIYFKYHEPSHTCKIFQVSLCEIRTARIELCVFRKDFFFSLRRTQDWLTLHFQFHLFVIHVRSFCFPSLSFSFFSSTPASINVAASFSLVTVLLTATLGSELSHHSPTCCPHLELGYCHPYSDPSKDWECCLYFDGQIP